MIFAEIVVTRCPAALSWFATFSTACLSFWSVVGRILEDLACGEAIGKVLVLFLVGEEVRRHKGKVIELCSMECNGWAGKPIGSHSIKSNTISDRTTLPKLTGCR
jgi:hypothetical protein